MLSALPHHPAASAFTRTVSSSALVLALFLTSCSGENMTAPATPPPPPPNTPPPKTSAPLQFAAVSAGSSSTCGVTTRGAAYCWGGNTSGALVNGTVNGASTIPVPVSGGLTFATVSVGESHACAVTTAGTAYCWGANYGGELGNGTTTSSATPVLVSGGLAFTSVSAGYLHTCGLTTGGTAYCWGTNDYGESGADTTATVITTPAPVSGGLTFAQVSAGARHTCGVTIRGAAYCWGLNASGELGNGTTTGPQQCSLPSGFSSPCSRIPVAVADDVSFARVNGGFDVTCAVATNGAAYCWGYNGAGALGNGTTADSPIPAQVSGGLTFATVSPGFGEFHSCGLTTGGAAYCWGDNYSGELGTGTSTSSTTPVLVSGGLTFAQVSAGYRHTCGVTTEGVAYCWGDNYWGALGIGNYTDAPSPTPVLGP